MSAGYLEQLDSRIGTGLAQLSESLKRAQACFVSELQRPDGGFPGRDGKSDVYYADFAIRTIVAAGPPAEASLASAAAFVTKTGPGVDCVVDCFSVLNCIRLLNVLGEDVAINTAPLIEVVARQLLPTGGYVRPGGTEISAYNTFIAALCHELTATEFPNCVRTVAGIRALQNSAGGFAETPGSGIEQTNATAAAIGFLSMVGGLSDSISAAAARFIARMQADDGGIRSHPRAPCSDLLSTFTGLVTLTTLSSIQTVDLGAIARFVRQRAVNTGGFTGYCGDAEADVEYTYYGIGSVALLRAAASLRETGHQSPM